MLNTEAAVCKRKRNGGSQYDSSSRQPEPSWVFLVRAVLGYHYFKSAYFTYLTRKKFKNSSVSCRGILKDEEQNTHFSKLRRRIIRRCRKLIFSHITALQTFQDVFEITTVIET